MKTFLEPKFAKRWIPFVEEIPRTRAGKLPKSELREQFKDSQWE